MNSTQPKIFIVEDNADIRQIYQLRFEVAGFKVVSAENGLDFITRIAEEKPDAVLLDLMLPEMDGFTVLQTLRNNFNQDETLKNTKIIAWSNLSEDSDIQKALSMGANYYLRKSDYEGDDLVTKVKDLLTREASVGVLSK
jgi:two-component system alkaline phosphatase synthesis response regulator PhoP